MLIPGAVGAVTLRSFVLQTCEERRSQSCVILTCELVLKLTKPELMIH